MTFFHQQLNGKTICYFTDYTEGETYDGGSPSATMDVNDVYSNRKFSISRPYSLARILARNEKN